MGASHSHKSSQRQLPLQPLPLSTQQYYIPRVHNPVSGNVSYYRAKKDGYVPRPFPRSNMKVLLAIFALRFNALLPSDVIYYIACMLRFLSVPRIQNMSEFFMLHNASNNVAFPFGITFVGDDLYYTEFKDKIIKKFSFCKQEWSVISHSDEHTAFGSQHSRFAYPAGICGDQSNLYFLENFRETNVNHVFLTENSGEEVSKRTVVCKDRFFNEPSLGICLDKDGFLLVCDTKNHCIVRMSVDAQGESVIYAGGFLEPGDVDGNLTEARFNFPTGICTDRCGNIFVSDDFNHKIKRIDPRTCRVTTYAGSVQGDLDGDFMTARFDHPQGICYYQGEILVIEPYSKKVRIISPLGYVRTLEFVFSEEMTRVNRKEGDHFKRPMSICACNDVTSPMYGTLIISDPRKRSLFYVYFEAGRT